MKTFAMSDRDREKMRAMLTLEGIRSFVDAETDEAERVLKDHGWSDAMITKWRKRRIPAHMRAKRS